MSRKRNDHFVPQFYLRRFSDDGRRIALFNLKTATVVPSASIKGQCQAANFYGRDRNLDDALTNLEALVSPLISRLVRVQCPPPPFSQEHQLLIGFTVAQMSRTKFSAAVIDELRQQLETHLKSKYAHAGARYVEEKMRSAHSAARMATANSGLVWPLALDLACKILRNDTQEEFCTSDNPVVAYNQFFEYRAESSGVGIGCRGLQLFFPIDPRHLLLFFDESVYRVGRDIDLVIRVDSRRDVAQLNRLQFVNGLSNVYFKNLPSDLLEQHKTSRRFARKSKSDFGAYPQDSNGTQSAELIRFGRTPVRIGLNLSFVSTRQRAKSWLTQFRRRPTQPAIIVRNERVMRDIEEWTQHLRGVGPHVEFFSHLRHKQILPSAPDPEGMDILRYFYPGI